MNSASAWSDSEPFDQYSLIVRSFDQLSNIEISQNALKITDTVFEKLIMNSALA